MKKDARHFPKSEDQKKRSMNSPWRSGPMCDTRNAGKSFKRYKRAGAK